MPTPNPKLGYECRLAIGAAVGATAGLDFVAEGMGPNEADRNLGGMRGTRAHALRRNRLVSRDPGGDVTMEPNAVEFGRILKYALGGTPAGTSFPLAEALPPYVLQLLSGDTLLNYTGCKAASLTIAARGKGANLQTVLSTVAMEETPVDNVASPDAWFNALVLDETTVPFVFEDLVLTVAGVSYDVFDWALTIDNFVRSRRVNSVTPTATYPTDRYVRWGLTLPWGDIRAIYGTGMALGGIALTAVFSTANTSLTLSSPAVKFPRMRRGINTRDEVLLPIQATALYSSAPGDELAVTLDQTP